MGLVRLHLESIIPVLLSVLLSLQIVTAQQCNCKNPSTKSMQGNDKINGMLLKQLNQLRDNTNLNTPSHISQKNKPSMPSMSSLLEGQNTQKIKQGEMQIPISSFKTINGNSDYGQRMPSINLGLLNPSATNNKGGISELKINKFQFIPNTPDCPCNQKPTPHFEAQMLPTSLAFSPEPTNTQSECQNQIPQVPNSPCAQSSQFNLQNQVHQFPVSNGLNMNLPQNLPAMNTVMPQNVENNLLMATPVQPVQQPPNLNVPNPEGPAGQGQNQPQIVYLVLPQPPPQQPAAVPPYTPPVYYAPAQSSSKSLSMKSLLPLLLEMLQEKKNCGCQSCPHCGSPLNQDQSMYGGYPNKNMYAPVSENYKEEEVDKPKISEKDKTSVEVAEKKKSSAEEPIEKSAAIKIPKNDKPEKEVEKSAEYIDPEFEEESSEDVSVEKE